MHQGIHRAISINTLCLEPAPLDVQANVVARLGARGISPTLDQVGDLGAARVDVDAVEVVLDDEAGHVLQEGVLRAEG